MPVATGAASRPRALASLAVTVLAVFLGVAVPAGAATPAPDGPERGIRLLLTLSEGEVPALPSRVATLRCRPTGGTHPAAAEVCARLRLVDGEPRLTGLPPGGACTLDHRPVTVTATGVGRGRPVEHVRTYPNRCALDTRTGPLFRF